MDYNTKRQLYRDVYEETIDVVLKGRYMAEDGTEVVLPDDQDLIAGSRFYEKAIELEEGQRYKETIIDVWNADSIDVGKRLLDEGYNPVVLNMANHQEPGGGVIRGSKTQEESLFRRTNLFRSMYQYASYASHYGLKRSHHQYPLDWRNGGVYSPGATVIRDKKLCLLSEPFRMSFVAVAAIAHPEVTQDGLLTAREAEVTKQKMRTIFRIAIHHNHDAVVLGAFGCGAFHNPPHHIARLFQEVMQEPEFLHRFRKIVFAILEDSNSPRGGNLRPFREVFLKNNGWMSKIKELLNAKKR